MLLPHGSWRRKVIRDLFIDVALPAHLTRNFRADAFWSVCDVPALDPWHTKAVELAPEEVGLLPIVRNTATGLQDIAPSVRESATALGLTSGARLRRIYLPIASRTILAGIKTSAVINIGTATLAALIGAGGLGEPIISGLNLNDHVTILEGAIPAALLALLVQFFFDLLDRVLIPRGLRL